MGGLTLEEIQCPLCKQQFNEKSRVPMLLPDCGHSYCQQCIEENSTEADFSAERCRATVTMGQDFDEASKDQLLVDDDVKDADRKVTEESLCEDEDLLAGDLDDSMQPKGKLTMIWLTVSLLTNVSVIVGRLSTLQTKKPQFTFTCPEDK